MLLVLISLCQMICHQNWHFCDSAVALVAFRKAFGVSLKPRHVTFHLINKKINKLLLSVEKYLKGEHMVQVLAVSSPLALDPMVTLLGMGMSPAHLHGDVLCLNRLDPYSNPIFYYSLQK